MPQSSNKTSQGGTMTPKQLELKRMIQAWRERDSKRGSDFVSCADWRVRYPEYNSISDELHLQLIQVLAAEVLCEVQTK